MLLTLLKVTALLAVILACSHVRALSAASRHMLCLVLLLSVPLLVFLPNALPAEIAYGVLVVEELTAEPAAMQTSVPQDLPTDMSSPGEVTTVPHVQFIWPLYLVGLLVSSVHLFALYWLGGRAVRRLPTIEVRRARCGEIPVRCDPAQRTPFVWGAAPATLVVPAAWYNWPASRRRMVWLHERAHIERLDFLRALVVRLFVCVLWFHPLAWLVQRRMTLLAECACDDAVIEHAKPASYAQTLVDVARQTITTKERPHAAPAMASSSHLAFRVQTLLDASIRRKPMKLTSRIFLAVSVAVFCTSLAAVRVVAQTDDAHVTASLAALREQIDQHEFARAEQGLGALLQRQTTAWGRAQINNMLGYARYLQGKTAQAEAAYSAVLEDADVIPEPMVRVVHYTLAQLNFVNGDYSGAKAHMDAWFGLAATPGAQPHMFRALVYTWLGDFDAALADVERAQALRETAGMDIPPHWQDLLAQLQRARSSGLSPFDDANRHYHPVVKVPPIYPPQARKRGVQGYVVVEFTVGADGTVINPAVVDAQPPGVFDQAALQAARKFTYLPQMHEGVAVPVEGVRNRINFSLAARGS